jgi:hypothetical protein
VKDEQAHRSGPDDPLLRAFIARTNDLEVAQRQLLAFRLEASLRAAFVLELQHTVAAALNRAEQAEHELRLARLALAEERAREAQRNAFDNERIRITALRLLTPILQAMKL